MNGGHGASFRFDTKNGHSLKKELTDYFKNLTVKVGTGYE